MMTTTVLVLCFNFLSRVKENFRKKNASWAIWRGHNGRNQRGGYGWYDDIRFTVIKAIVARIFESGGTLKEMSLPLGRSLLKNMIESLLKLGDQDSLEVCAVLGERLKRLYQAGMQLFTISMIHVQSCTAQWHKIKLQSDSPCTTMPNFFNLNPTFWSHVI